MKMSEITTILQTDQNTEETYLKIPITDLVELNYMQQSLLENLNLLSQLEKDTDVKDIVFWLSKILLASYPEDELIALSKITRTASKLL
ncbi:hypothetical protein NBT05_17220 [Aquimarina sp. ERC-38]|uniref:hypothetical protein n=1 Tax=Aquimarina sp. ERC-38 TaxID=2949996 RepID=UPI002247C3C7|nr:hypothetical protein [Aquimarina sp. ERC-38]UZO80655.1 hypothetical protein NBT05_17150 [Aquimarina sp. ERC-38]UZO80669.1 hypothetical protein NBT05_17220 [Aquimarina sp. ERC-38]